MDVASVLRDLWLRRAWMVVGVAVAILVAVLATYKLTLNPPGLHSKNLTVNTAETSILVDSPTGAITDLSADLKGLTSRATVYATFFTSLPARRAIARASGLHVDQVNVEAAETAAQPSATKEPVAVQRSQGILKEQIDHFVRLSTVPGVPTVHIDAQAPSRTQALRLANGAARGLRLYVSGLEAARHTPPPQRVTIRQLGSAEGGTLGKHVKRTTTILAFVGALVAWAILVLLFNNVARGWRELEAKPPDE